MFLRESKKYSSEEKKYKKSTGPRRQKYLYFADEVQYFFCTSVDDEEYFLDSSRNQVTVARDSTQRDFQIKILNLREIET